MAAESFNLPGTAARVTTRQPLGQVIPRRRGAVIAGWLSSTDHKVIGNLYFITAFIWFLLAGIMALLIRAELFEPGMQVFNTKNEYNQAFTMHGTIMLLLFATPLR